MKAKAGNTKGAAQTKNEQKNDKKKVAPAATGKARKGEFESTRGGRGRAEKA